MQSMEVISEEKARGDAAFRDGNYEDAYNLYTEALEDDEVHIPTLCNRSLAALKLGRLEESLEDADAALQLVQGSAQPAERQQLLAKAVHRKAEALMALGDAVEAVRAYRRGLAACPGSPELHAALRLAVEDLPAAWLAAYWAARVEEAQAPNPLSSRDGRLVRRVPPELALAPGELRAHLQAALATLQDEARDLMCEAWAEARRPGRAAAALMRGAAYLSAGNAKQALKDARFALAYGPQMDRSLLAAEGEEEARVDLAEKAANRALAPSNGGNGGAAAAKAAPQRLEDSLPSAALAGRSSAWPAALALHAAALEALPQPDTVLAALSLARAAELEPDNEEHAAGLERLMRRMPQHQALALKAGGSAALEAQLAGEREAARPEYLRARPKYYYYFEWMRRRIEEQYPALPEAVMDKMLSLEANELDMLLQYPKATQLTVERLLGVFEDRGEAALEQYVVPLLSWSDFQAIKEEAAAPALLPPQDPSAAIKRLLPRSVPPPREDSAASATAQPCAGDCQLEGGGAASEAGSLDLDDLCGLD